MSHDGVSGVVLAGGRGTRLRPLTDTTNKHLLPVGGTPIVVHALRQLVAAGVLDALLVIDDRHATEFVRLLGDGRRLGLRSLAYVWQPYPGLGMPTAISSAEHVLRTPKFVVACGDVLTDALLTGALADFARQGSGARMVGVRTADTAGFSRLDVDGDVVTGIQGKDRNRHGPGLIDLGFYLYHHDVFDQIRALRPSARGETEIWDLNRNYAALGALRLSEVHGWWADAGGSRETYTLAGARYA
jgi:glucose-1-phosphate thymidylyltransferase